MLRDRNDSFSLAMSVDAIADWAREQVVSGELRYYCPSCLTMLVHTSDDEEGHWYCPNEMCSDEREWIEEGD